MSSARPAPPVLLSLAAWALLLVACGGEDRPERLSAVLITLDTTNPGALDLYGEDRGLTPALAAVAREAEVFDAAWSVAPLTLPSHSSILTGLYPPRHGVHDNGLVPLPQSADTLAERARAAGHRTAAFVSAVVLGRVYGLDQGFEVYDEPTGSAGGALAHMVERDADAVTRAAQTWLAGRDRDEPFFLWVHYFDPHAPYEPPPRFLEQAGGQPYLGEVARMDAAIGRLLETLDGEVGRERYVLCVVADHGESLGRHGEPTHSVLCYDATQRVPLLLRRPGGEARRDGRTASIVDVHPTLLELLDLGPPGDVDGVSLLAAADPARGVYLESWCGYLNYGWSPLVGWIQGGRKYLHSSSPELYDLALDPREERDLLAREDPLRRAELTAPFRSALEELLARRPLRRSSGEDSVGDVQAQMQALGYAGAARPDEELPHPLLPSDRPAPATRTDELAAFYEAALQAGRGRRREAIDTLRQVTDANPRNVYALGALTGLLIEERRHAEALPLLQRLVADGHERVPLLLQLADCLAATDRPAEARTVLERARALRPGDREVEAALERLAP